MPAATKARSLFARLARLIFALALTLAGIAVAAWLASRPAMPDAFYGQALPSDTRRGALLGSEPYTTSLPAGAQGWRIVYATTRGGAPALASAVVVQPTLAAPERSVIAWAHGTTGIVEGCAPSVMGRPFDNVPAMTEIVRQGWAYVGTDYPGLGTGGGHAYLVGEDAARAVLDAVRAARQLQGADIGDRLVVWGHSQGGNSALWAGMRASDLAPELQVVGVAALAPASDLKELVQASKGSMFGKIVSSYLLASYARTYPDVKFDDYAAFPARVVARDIANRCIAGYATLFSVVATKLLPARGLFSRDPTSGPLGARLGENTPTGAIKAPVLIAQGEADDLVLPDVQKRYVQARCAAGQPIDYRTYPGRDHVSVVADGSPLASELMQWSRDRFDGKPAASTCP